MRWSQKQLKIDSWSSVKKFSTQSYILKLRDRFINYHEAVRAFRLPLERDSPSTQRDHFKQRLTDEYKILGSS